jgi:hypothetical protein
MTPAPWTWGPGEILRHALSLLRRDSDTNRRLALISTDNAVELMIKTYLRLPKRVTGLDIGRREFEEIGESFPKLLEALERHASGKLKGIDSDVVFYYHQTRNRLYHEVGALVPPRRDCEGYVELARHLFRNLFGHDLEITDDNTQVTRSVEIRRRVGRLRRQPSARAEAYRAFFQELVDELRETHRFTGAKTARPQSWYPFASGTALGIYYVTSFAHGDRVRTEVYIDVGDENQNKEIFDRLFDASAEIEAQFGEKLSWERLDGKRASRVAVYRPGNIDMDPPELTDIRRWSVDCLLKFKRVIGPRLIELLK